MLSALCWCWTLAIGVRALLLLPQAQAPECLFTTPGGVLHHIRGRGLVLLLGWVRIAPDFFRVSTPSESSKWTPRTLAGARWDLPGQHRELQPTRAEDGPLGGLWGLQNDISQSCYQTIWEPQTNVFGPFFEPVEHCVQFVAGVAGVRGRSNSTAFGSVTLFWSPNSPFFKGFWPFLRAKTNHSGLDPVLVYGGPALHVWSEWGHAFALNLWPKSTLSAQQRTQMSNAETTFWVRWAEAGSMCRAKPAQGMGHVAFGI